jgi:hypothetical protein
MILHLDEDAPHISHILWVYIFLKFPCCFLVYGKYFPTLPLVFIYFIYPLHSPGILSPSPCALWLYGHIQSFSSLLVSNYLWLFWLACPVLFLFGGPPGLLTTDSCDSLVGWGLRSLNAAFPCWSCLTYIIFYRRSSDLI